MLPSLIGTNSSFSPERELYILTSGWYVGHLFRSCFLLAVSIFYLVLKKEVQL
jgi:hypothetical protein